MKKANILVVDDDPTFRKTLANLLKSNGYDVSAAADYQEALEIAKRKVFELIIADVRLPGGIDGIETVAKIKSEGSKSAKSLIITATIL